MYTLAAAVTTVAIVIGWLSILFELQLIGMNMRKLCFEIMAQQRLHLDRHQNLSLPRTLSLAHSLNGINKETNKRKKVHR